MADSHPPGSAPGLKEPDPIAQDRMNPEPQSEFELIEFVDLQSLQALQDGFAGLTGITTSIRDPNGLPITRTAGRPRYCEWMSSSPSGEAACRASHVAAAELAKHSQAPCSTCCHAGLSQFVAPIQVDGRHLGTILLGDRPERPLDDDTVAELARAHALPADALRAAAGRLDAWSDETMSSAVGFVQQLANTLARLCYNAHQLRCRIDDLAAVHGVAAKLAGRVELQEILDTATRQLMETMGLRAAAIRLLEEETGVLKIASVCNLSKRYLDKEPIPIAASPIDREALEGHTVYIRDLRSDARTYYKEKARAEGLVSAMVAPLQSGGRPIGVLRGYMDRVYAFSSFDASLMEAIAAQVAAAIVNARLRRDAAESERLNRQVRLAGEVQRRMIPAATPASRHYEFGCVYQPSAELGGDFYDFLEYPNGEIGVVIADVVGKGVPASLMMASARSALRAHAKCITEISELISEVNHRLCRDTLAAEFVTAFYAVLDPAGRHLRYCNAGHEPLLLLRGGTVRTLDVGGLVLGLDCHAPYEWAEEALEPGDLLVLVTDGVVEAMNYDDVAYGRARLIESILRYGCATPWIPIDQVAKQLFWDVRRFTGLSRMEDDITIVATRVWDGKKQFRVAST